MKDLSQKLLFILILVTGQTPTLAESKRLEDKEDKQSLFLSSQGERLSSIRVKSLVKQYAERVGLHDPNSDWLADRFSPYCIRHFFTTALIRAGMPRDFVKELGGDARREAIDIYNHIDKKELRVSIWLIYYSLEFDLR